MQGNQEEVQGTKEEGEVLHFGHDQFRVLWTPWGVPVLQEEVWLESIYILGVG